MKANYDAVVIEVSFKEIREETLKGVGQNIEEDYPDHKIELYTAVDDGYLFVLRPKE
jgi:hypothetical protein